ncbi:NB-ARC domain-containing protein [Microbispora amethystogenes]|uniref:NB-ARC domain-containing protein n=1 Tax=Microbispora amethystogenes TaxID=1427754 RepID=A0ABQ4FED6_9ACTN|nr:NB-ARC domain-containing protein [Microbispora amethystogenes]GIH33185.1 hypothetical protein Mam01_33490 [Microbispora amethystogenes]
MTGPQTPSDGEASAHGERAAIIGENRGITQQGDNATAGQVVIEKGATVHGGVHLNVAGAGTSQATPAALFMAPTSRLRDFVERPAVGDALVEALVNPAFRGGGPIVVTGAGGYGKTLLAAWACRQVKDHFPDGVLWVAVGRRPHGATDHDPRLISVLSDLITLLTGDGPAEYRHVPTAAAAFVRALGDRRILLVLDDAWDTEDVEWFLGGRQCVTLVTSRQRPIARGHHEVRVGPMTTREATALLLQKVAGSSAREVSPLLERCGRWPLALSLLGGTLRSVLGRMPLAAVVQELAAALDHRGVSVLDEHAHTNERRIAATLDISLEELAATSPHGEGSRDRYRQLAAFPEEAPIPYQLLERLWGLDVAGTESECVRFFNHSLLETVEPDGVRLHVVLRDLLRHRDAQLVGRTSRALLEACHTAAGWHALPLSPHPDLGPQLAYHLLQAGQRESLGMLMQDFRYLVTRIHHGGPAAAESDLQAYIAADDAHHEDNHIRRLLAMLRRYPNLPSNRNMERTDVALTLYSRLFGHVEIDHFREELPDCGLFPVQPFPYVAEPRHIRSLSGHHGQVSSAFWQNDGLLMTVGGDDGTIRRWNPQSGVQESQLQIDAGLVLKAWLSPDQHHLAVFGAHPKGGHHLANPITHRDGLRQPGQWLRILITDTSTGKVRAEFPSTEKLVVGQFLHGGSPAMAWSPDSRLLALAAGDDIQLWSPFDGRLLRTLRQAGAVRSMDWHPAGGLACLTGYGTVIRWPDPASSDHAHHHGMFGEESQARALAWSPDGRKIAVAADREIGVVGVAPTGLGKAWEGHAWWFGFPCAISWRPDSRAFAIASNGAGIWGGTGPGSMVSLWNVDDPQGRTYKDIDSRYTGVLDLAWGPADDQLAVAYVDSTVRLWRPTARQQPAVSNDRLLDLADHFKSPIDRAIDAVTAPLRDRLVVRNVKSTIPAVVYERAEATDTTWTDGLITITSDGLSVIGEWADADEFEWVMGSTQLCQDFRIASGVAVNTFGFPDMRLTLRGADGLTIETALWPKPRGLAVDPTSSRIATVSEDGGISLFDTRTLRRICTVSLGEAALACAFGPTGERLAVVGSTGLYLLTLSPHT